MSLPKTSDARYPVVAVPECCFQALNRAIHVDPFSTASVNTTIQQLLKPVDYAFILGSGIVMHAYKPYKADWKFDVGKVRQVRVTADQFDLLREAQSEYYNLGYRVSIASILAAVLSQLNSNCLVALKRSWEVANSPGAMSKDKHCYMLIKRGQDKLIQVKWRD